MNSTDDGQLLPSPRLLPPPSYPNIPSRAFLTRAIGFVGRGEALLSWMRPLRTEHQRRHVRCCSGLSCGLRVRRRLH
jgi:hypothetical protein